MKKVFDIKDNKNKEFWFSNIIMLLATVIAVYLAASAGLKTAVQFELIKADKDSYYMRRSFLDELNDNINNMEKWGKKYRSGGAGDFWRNPNDYTLDTYVWNAMKEQESTFEIPNKILSKIRKYYIKSNIVLNKMKSRGAAAKIVDQMLIENKNIKKTVMKNLQNNIQNLKIKLQNNGIEVK